MNAAPRQRWKLALIALLFLAPFVAALVLRFSGWDPPRTRNHGELLQPPLPMHALQARRADGSGWTFENVDRQWSLLLRRPAECGADCTAELELLPRVRDALGRHAPKLHLFALDAAGGSAMAADGSAPPPLRLSGDLPAPLRTPPPATRTELWLVDPHGYLVLHYPPGYDPSGLRRDLARLVR